MKLYISKRPSLSTLTLVVLTVYGLNLMSCGDDDSGPSVQDTTTDALVNDGASWVIAGGRIIKDEVDVTDNFPDFEISFSGTTYSSSGGGGVWPEATSASWSYANSDPNDASEIIRADGIEVRIVVSKGTELTMDFRVTESSGRASGLEGNYTFELPSEN